MSAKVFRLAPAAEELAYLRTQLRWRSEAMAEDAQFRALRLGFGRAAARAERDERSAFRGDEAPSGRRLVPAVAEGRRPSGGTRVRRRAVPVGWVALAALLLLVTMPFWGFAAWAHLGRAAVADKYEQLRSRSRAIVVLGADGVAVGLQHQPGRRRDDMIVLPSRVVPDDFFSIYRALENPDSGSPLRNWYGLDFQSAGIGFVCTLWTEISRADGNCRGGSTLEMQAARGWQGHFGGKSNHDVATQFSYMLDAAALSLLHPRDSQTYRIMIADSLTYGTAPGGRDMHGLRLASLTTFGVEPENLRLSQSAILAAMPLRRIAWTCDPVFRPTKKGLEALGAIKTRAIDGLRKAFPDSARAAQAVEEIKAMTLPTRPAPLDPALTAGLTERDACLAAANPIARAEMLAGPELVSSRSELGPAVPGEEPATRLMLTTSASEQRRYSGSISRALAEVQRSQAKHLYLGVRGPNPAADTLAVRVEQGAVTGLYTSVRRAILDEAGRTGSIGKLVVAVAAAAQGRSVDAPLCQRKDSRSGLREVNGFAGYDHCRGPALISLSRSYGESLNLPILHLARSLDQDGLRSVAARLGFSFPAGTDLPYALVTGMGEATPRNLLAMEHALARAAVGLPAVAPIPYVVARVEIGGRWLSPERRQLDLGAILATPAARSFIRNAASAALREPRGTLRGTVAGNRVGRYELAKSGTVAGPRPALDTVRKLAVGATSFRSAWFAMIAAPRGMLGDRYFGMIPLSRQARIEALSAEAAGLPELNPRPANRDNYRAERRAGAH